MMMMRYKQQGHHHCREIAQATIILRRMNEFQLPLGEDIEEGFDFIHLIMKDMRIKQEQKKGKKQFRFPTNMTMRMDNVGEKKVFDSSLVVALVRRVK
jgi:hypothetical protein